MYTLGTTDDNLMHKKFQQITYCSIFINTFNRLSHMLTTDSKEELFTGRINLWTIEF